VPWSGFDLGFGQCGRPSLVWFVWKGYIRFVRAVLCREGLVCPVKIFFGVWAERIGLCRVLCFGFCMVVRALLGVGLAHFQCCQNALSMLSKVTFHVAESDGFGDVSGVCGRRNFRRRRHSFTYTFFYHCWRRVSVNRSSSAQNCRLYV